MRVLIVGATGTIGHHAVTASLEAGHETRTLVRDLERARRLLPDAAELVLGDGTEPGALTAAAEGIEGVVFTHGSHGGGREAERIDYGIVRNVMHAIGGRPVRIALMTAIGVTVAGVERSAWKRRSERLVRRSGHPYTIVRPSWFDYNEPDQRRIVFLQGDTHRTGTPADGQIARDEIARVLVESLTSPGAERKTLELRAETGAEQGDLEPLFDALKADPEGAFDGVLDPDTLPLAEEPAGVMAEIDAVRKRFEEGADS